jgi:hypothetical protein
MSRSREWMLALLLALLLAGGALLVAAEPNGAAIQNNVTVTNTPQAAASITTAGGTFTTLLLNATTQTLRWKAYVGNVTGTITLDDALNLTIYDWTPITISGEVYASRNSSIDWSSISCANNSTVISEETQLNLTTTKADSINQTFNRTIHRGFYVGTTLVANSTCRAIATYVNNARQTVTEAATFQEILLRDSSNRLVYTTLIENDAQGYNNGPFDFQLIVAERDTNPAPSTYYFWAEIS